MHKTQLKIGLAIFVCLISISCSNKSKRTEENIENNQITIIFENQGKLINEFAPRPSDEKIIKLINEQLIN